VRFVSHADRCRSPCATVAAVILPGFLRAPCTRKSLLSDLARHSGQETPESKSSLSLVPANSGPTLTSGSPREFWDGFGTQERPYTRARRLSFPLGPSSRWPA